MDEGDPDHPTGRRVGVVGLVEHQPARAGCQDRVGEQQARRRKPQALGPVAQLVAERGDRVEHPERGEHDERESERVVIGIGEPRDELRRARDEGGSGEPVPALPEEHAGRRDEGDRHEREGDAGCSRIDEDR